MKKIQIAFLSLLVNFCFSQEKINTLSTPTSPAASILGMQPSTILKPKSYRALEAAMYSNFTDADGNSIIPNDFGLEFTPYWATNHGISIENYLFPKFGFEQIVRNSSFSVATTQKFLLQDSTETKSIALGYRTSLFFGNETDKKKIVGYIDNLSTNQRVGSKIIAVIEGYREKNLYTTKEEYLVALKNVITLRIQSELKSKSKQEVETIVENIYKETDALPFDNDAIDAFEIALSNLIEEKIGTNYEEFKTYIKNRQGLMIDFACAAHINFPDNDFEFSEVPKYALWLSPSYNFSNKLNFLKATGTIRYERYFKSYFEKYFPNSKVFDNNIDYGVSVAGEFKKFTIAFEATGRASKSLVKAGQDSSGNNLYLKENASDFQYIGTFSYRLTDQIAVTYQLGSSFKPTFNVNGGTLISLLSLNLGFGGPTTTDITTN